MAAPPTYSVGHLTRYIKQLLETDPVLHDVWVTGEVSNLTVHGSGHVYFSLKDAEAQLSCAMFKNVAVYYQRRMPRHGDRLVVRGELSLYPPRGSYQLIVREMQMAGEGDLHQRFLALRDRLLAEGLFDAARKRPVPPFPRRIGIATSPTGAVIRDIIDTIRRRYPHVALLLAPTVVQGEAGADSIVRSLAQLNAQPDLDVIILARGGGSLEDLWCFNEERVARAIAASRVPVVAGIGHETDTTIADFVADLRAATPTAAAELVVPRADDIRAQLDQAQQAMGRSLRHFIEVRQQLLDDCAAQMQASLLHQLARARQQVDHLEGQLQTAALAGLALRRQHVAALKAQLEQAAMRLVADSRHKLDLLALQLQQYDHRSVLGRGYTITTKGGKPVTDAAALSPGDRVTTYYLQGKSTSTIDATEEGHA